MEENGCLGINCEKKTLYIPSQDIATCHDTVFGLEPQYMISPLSEWFDAEANASALVPNELIALD